MNKDYKELIIKILEDIGNGIALKYNKYSVSRESFSSMLDYIKSKDFARGVCVVRNIKGSNVKVAGCMNPYLTMNGVNYLNKNL